MIRRFAVVALVVSFCATGFAEEPQPKWPGVHDLVSSLQRAIEIGDGELFVSLVDMGAMVDEILDGTDSTMKNPRFRAGFTAGLEKSLKASASKRALLYPFVSFEVHRVTNIDRQKMHLYLTKHGAGWRMYDYMDADGGLRLSVLGRVAVVQVMPCLRGSRPQVLEMLLLHLPAHEKVSLKPNLLVLNNWALSQQRSRE